jgi:hypothetical protein
MGQERSRASLMSAFDPLRTLALNGPPRSLLPDPQNGVSLVTADRLMTPTDALVLQ